MVGRKRIGNALVSDTAKKARKLVVGEISNNVMKAQDKNPNSSGSFKIINDAILVYPWLTKDIVYGHIRRIKANVDTQKSRIVTVNANTSDIVSATNVNGGRPKGATVKSKLDVEAKEELARNQIANLCLQARKDNNGRLARHKYKEIHDGVIKTLCLNEAFSVSFELIKSRLRRNRQVLMTRGGVSSPLAPIEPVVMQIVVWKQEAGQPITPKEGLALVNSMIDGKPLQETLKTFQQSKKKQPTGML